jgi:hypothetical protein
MNFLRERHRARLSTAPWRGLYPESTDKDIMKGKDRLGDGSANWQFAPLDQRPFDQAQALSSVAQFRSMSDKGSGANCQFALPFSTAPFPQMFFI